MKQKSISLNSDSEIVYIGGIGFMFEVRQSHKHNLMSPKILSFFNGVEENGIVKEDCAFPIGIPSSNLRKSLFLYKGRDLVLCSDGVFRKCAMVECEIRQNDEPQIATFYIDRSIKNIDILGVISKS